ncbi:MAG: hypothetical protein HQL32_07720 [Planctomycetes bacterium]|nr:hypothetical protein [Planctomycetota bacterium]
MTNLKNNDLRIFACIFCTGFTFLTWFFSWPTITYAYICGLGALGLCLPKLLIPLYKFWLFIGGILGYINIRIILGLSYYLLITPMAVFFRIIGRDKLNLKMNDCTTYWEDYDSQEYTLERYRKLF